MHVFLFLWCIFQLTACKYLVLQSSSFYFLFRDGHGCTAFMLALAGRAYPAGLVILDTAQCIAKIESGDDAEAYKKLMMSMLNPRGGGADNSPLHVLCCNDTCSFTWTGAEHINQVCSTRQLRCFRIDEYG